MHPCSIQLAARRSLFSAVSMSGPAIIAQCKTVMRARAAIMASTSTWISHSRTNATSASSFGDGGAMCSKALMAATQIASKLRRAGWRLLEPPAASSGVNRKAPPVARPGLCYRGAADPLLN